MGAAATGVAAGGSAAVELYWLPLGAGGHSVRFNGRVYEALVAARDRRPRFDLYHAALRVLLPEATASSSNRRPFPIGVAASVASSSRARWAADGLGDFPSSATRSGSGLAARFPTSRRPLTARDC